MGYVKQSHREFNVKETLGEGRGSGPETNSWIQAIYSTTVKSHSDTVSQVEMISYIAQQIPIFHLISLSTVLLFDQVPHFHWIK